MPYNFILPLCHPLRHQNSFQERCVASLITLRFYVILSQIKEKTPLHTKKALRTAENIYSIFFCYFSNNEKSERGYGHAEKLM